MPFALNSRDFSPSMRRSPPSFDEIERTAIGLVDIGACKMSLREILPNVTYEVAGFQHFVLSLRSSYRDLAHRVYGRMGFPGKPFDTFVMTNLGR